MGKVIIFLLFLSRGLSAQTWSQGSWHGGDGVCGVVSSWGTQFCSQDSVAWGMRGQINPVATAYDWSNWILDTVEVTTPGRYGNVFPADMDGDGDYDLVGYRGYTRLTIYLNDGLGNFTPLEIEDVSSFGNSYSWPVWVKDVDLDGRPDIVAPMQNGLYVYYQTGSLSFTREQVVNSLSSAWCGTYISYADAGDVDGDGDVDIVATNGCGPGAGGGGGDVYLFRNDGGGTWTPILIYNSYDDNHKAMRIYLTDFNGDGRLDILTSYWPVMVFRNSGGSFTLSNYFGGSSDNADGAWPIDVDGDGDVDIVYAPYQSGYYLSYRRNDGGFSFTRVNVASGVPYDGLSAGDFNADGNTDFLGALYVVDVYVGPSYTRYTLSGSSSNKWNIHNLYFANVESEGCFDIQQDIIFTNLTYDPGSGYTYALGHYMLKNRTVTRYASHASLTSSILEVPIGSCALDTLYYVGCVPSNWEMNVYVRWGGTASDIATAPWVGPVTSGTSLIGLGLRPSGDNYVQYRVEFVRTGLPENNAPMLDSIWIAANCDYIGQEDDLAVSERKDNNLSERVIYTVDGRRIDRMEPGRVYFIKEGGRLKKVIKR